MAVNQFAITIRTKKLGVLLRDARQLIGKTIPDCAHAIGVTPTQYEAYEFGEQCPSLPELEILSYFLNASMDYFMGTAIASKSDKNPLNFDTEKLIKLRQKMIGVLLRQSRVEAGMSEAELAQKTGLATTDLEKYELGESGIPFPIFEILISSLHRTTKDFQDRQGPLSRWEAQQKAVKGFSDLPIELQEFITKPINRPYLELAQRLSEMSVEKLRAVAEGLLEITL